MWQTCSRGYRHGGVCEMVKEGENGHLAIPNQPAELSKANQELTDNTEKREKFGKASVKRQKELFSLQSYIRNEKSYIRNIKEYQK